MQGAKALRFLWMPVAIAVLTALVLNGTPLRAPLAGATLLYEAESPYNYVQVQEDARWQPLSVPQRRRRRPQPVESRLSTSTGAPGIIFLAAPYFNAPPFAPQDVHSLAIVGLAGGTIARQYTPRLRRHPD